MIPRALATETIELLKPLSCHAIAAASDPGTPCWAAIEEICDASSRPPVATGVDPAEVAGAAALGVVTPGAGRRRKLPASRMLAGSRPLAPASEESDTPCSAAIALNESPSRTR